ncbi:MAG: efflux transporter outer membrane subunit [Henriciella sp.]
MSRLSTIIASALVLTAACATQTTDLDVHSVAEVPQDWAMAEGETEAVLSGWLEAVDDPKLKALVEEALSANSEIGAAQGRLKRARAILSQSRAAQRPNLNAEGRASVSEGFAGSADTSVYTGALNASWEADLWGRLSSASAADARFADAAEADFKATQQLIAASTARAYFLLIEANQLADVEQSNLESLEETLGFVSIQFERGLRSSEDIALIRADVETSKASLDLAYQSQRNATRAIEILVGRYPTASLEVGSQGPMRPVEAVIGQPADLLGRRPDIRSARLTLLGEYARTKSARADLLPRLSVQASFDGTSSTLEDLFDPTALAASLLVNGTQALFDGGARRARIRAAEADAEIALANYQLLILDAFNEVETELDRGGVLERRETFLTKALSEAEDALQFSRFRYELGESDLLNVLSIQQRVASLQSELARTKRARLDQYVALALALGQEI